MTTNIAEREESTQPTGAAVEPKSAKKAARTAQKAHVAPAKGKSADKAGPGKKAPKNHKKAATSRQGSKKAKSGNRASRASRAEKVTPAREGSKTAQILDLLKRPGGATLQEIMKLSEWQSHSIRGFISGTLGKKMGLTVESTKGEDGERTYWIKA